MNYKSIALNWRKNTIKHVNSVLLATFLVFFALPVPAIPMHVDSARPVWVNEPTREYPPDEYIIGIGSGKSEEEAISSARADLAAGFRARISSKKTMEDEIIETFGNKDNSFDRVTQTYRSTEVEASENLTNVTRAGIWFDEVSGRYHALVFIKRDEAENTIGTEIQNLLEQIRELIDYDYSNSDILDEYAGAAKAATLYREYESLCAQLGVVSEGKLGTIDASLGLRVNTDFSQAGSRLTLKIKSAPDDLISTLRDALIKAGFTVVNEKSVFTAELAFKTSQANYSGPFIFESWEMNLRIRYSSDGSEVVSLNWFDRAGHNTRKAAQERCVREARMILTDSLSMKLDSFLTGQ